MSNFINWQLIEENCEKYEKKCENCPHGRFIPKFSSYQCSLKDDLYASATL